jgi:glutamate synthase (NADPH/NADH) large chain
VSNSSLPMQQGLYDPRQERDACGVGFVAHIKGEKSHGMVSQGLQILENLTHRGAVGADPLAGDGAGILLQIPDAFLRAQCAARNVVLPAVGSYGVGMLFLPRDAAARDECEKIVAAKIAAEGQLLLGWMVRFWARASKRSNLWCVRCSSRAVRIALTPMRSSASCS